MGDGPVRLLTWNVQGARGVDVERTAAIIRVADPDVVALQEIQRRQVAALAGALSMTSRRWAFKHWPIVTRAEGLAVLSRHRIVQAAPFLLRRRPFWDWRRRVGLGAAVAIGDRATTVLDVHLSPHDEGDRRTREAGMTLRRADGGDPAPLIVGDLNDVPDTGADAAFLAAGWVDCWRAVNGGADPSAGATNWTAGPRRGRPPTQRIDFILAPAGSTVVSSAVVTASEHLDDLATLSDHLPLLAAVRLPDGHP